MRIPQLRHGHDDGDAHGHGDDIHNLDHRIHPRRDHGDDVHAHARGRGHDDGDARAHPHRHRRHHRRGDGDGIHILGHHILLHHGDGGDGGDKNN